MYPQRDTDAMLCPILNIACKGPRCMMWRWATVEQEARSTHERVRLDDGIGLDVAAGLLWPGRRADGGWMTGRDDEHCTSADGA